MDVILSTVKWHCVLTYLDDIVNFSRAVAEHLEHIRTVLGLLSRARFSIVLKKCFSFDDRIHYLGDVIQPGKRRISTKVTDSVRGLQNSTDATKLKSCLLLLNKFH